MAGDDWARWLPVLEKMLADLTALNAYLRGEISHEDYRRLRHHIQNTLSR